MGKEENAIILDYLPNGYPLDTRPIHKKTPIAQAIGKEFFVLLELVPKKGEILKVNEEVYLGEGKRDKIHHILGRIPLSKLTQTAKSELDFVMESLVDKYEKRFMEFFSTCQSINARRHQLELIPGIGKKHMWEILEERKDKPFESFDEMKKRVKLLPNPKQAVIKRILMEINNEDKYKLFTG